ncbi:hypothetical protein NECAME_18979 [Necator americanus]|uniref:Uncharacterized protein n=1 Tax=Necator americanus TaxID=51031 RepID=W2STL5_NECAM|nr:hypothetical protein NECAME_18979 [Necator americanus]ETN72186.1 hypothetical protein NECAME_18979 [Necator americanus]
MYISHNTLRIRHESSFHLSFAIRPPSHKDERLMFTSYYNAKPKIAKNRQKSVDSVQDREGKQVANQRTTTSMV